MGRNKNIGAATLAEIAEMFKNDVPLPVMSINTGYAVGTLQNKITYLKKLGVIPDRERKVDLEDGKKHYSKEKAEKERAYLRARRKEAEQKGVVYCDLVTAKKCAYGTTANFETQGLCNYLLLTGQRRGCSPEACSKYLEMETATQKAKFQRQCYMKLGYGL